MRLGDVVNRGIYIIKDKGILAFISSLFVYIRSAIYGHGIYDIYETRLPLENILVFDIGDAYLIPVSTIVEYQKLVQDGFDFSGIAFVDKISKGSLAFCIFVGRKLAHVTWVAFSGEAKKEIDPLPFKVNYQDGEVCSGASFTDPDQRGKGFLKAIYSYIFPYLSDRGVKRVLYTIDKDNISSQRALLHFHPSLISEGYYSKLLYWQFWEEKRIERK